MKKNLAKAITLGLLLTGSCLLGGYNTAFAAGNVDVDGYGNDEITKTATKNSGVLFDGGWYAPDGKFYCYVDENGEKTDTLQQYNVSNGKAVLTDEARNTLTGMGLDHNQQADAVSDNKQVPTYLDMFGGNKFTAENIADALADNLKFNSDLVRTVVEWEEADRKATDMYLDDRIDAIGVTTSGNNSFTFTDGDGEETVITFEDTDTNTVNQSLTADINSNGILSVTVKDSNGDTVSGSANIGEYVKNNAGNATYEGNITINQQIKNNTEQITQNTNQINTNTQNIEAIQKNYVTNITQTSNNTWEVTQNVNGEENNITITNTNTTNKVMDHSWNGDDVTIQVTDTDDDSVQTTITDVARASALKAEKERAENEEKRIEEESKDRDKEIEAESQYRDEILNDRVDSLNNRIDRLEDEAHEGIAIAMAMSGITPLQHDPADPEKQNRFQGGMAVSTWKGRQAIAAGGFYTPHRDAIYTFKIGTSLNGHHCGAVVGATFRFKQRKEKAIVNPENNNKMAKKVEAILKQ